jgi:hypothetical protein
LGAFEDRLKRLVAFLYGPPMKTIPAEVLERRGEMARLYVSWMMGEVEEPEFEDPEDARLWVKMAAYEEAAVSVADAPTEEDLAVKISPEEGLTNDTWGLLDPEDFARSSRRSLPSSGGAPAARPSPRPPPPPASLRPGSRPWR